LEVYTVGVTRPGCPVSPPAHFIRAAGTVAGGGPSLPSAVTTTTTREEPMDRPELTLLLDGQRPLTLEDAVWLQRIGRLYRFGVPVLDRR
jgi:hypothetical protein